MAHTRGEDVNLDLFVPNLNEHCLVSVLTAILTGDRGFTYNAKSRLSPNSVGEPGCCEQSMSQVFQVGDHSIAHFGSLATALLNPRTVAEMNMSETSVVRSDIPYFCMAMPPVRAQVKPFDFQTLAR